MSGIQTWLENLPDRGDETLVGVPPSALAELLEERDKLRKEHRAMSKGAQTNAETAKRQAEKIAKLREQLRAVTAERDALREERDLYADSFQRWSLLEHDIRIGYDLPTGRYRAWLDDDPEQEVWADYAQHAVEELWRRVNNAD